MSITECQAGQTLLGVSGQQYRVTAVNPKSDRCDAPHVLADAITPTEFDGATLASFVFSEKALSHMQPVE